MNLKPLSDRLIVQRVMAEQPVSAGGILLPPTEETQETPFTGLVMAVGPGKPCALQPVGQDILDVLQDLINTCRNLAESGHGIAHQAAQSCIEDAMEKMSQHSSAVTRAPMQVKVGDKVIYSRHGHQEFRLDGVDLVTFGQDSVIGVVDERSDSAMPYP